jgi:hypothetical protein
VSAPDPGPAVETLVPPDPTLADLYALTLHMSAQLDWCVNQLAAAQAAFARMPGMGGMFGRKS